MSKGRMNVSVCVFGGGGGGWGGQPGQLPTAQHGPSPLFM